MREKVLKFVFNYLQVHLFTGICSALLAIYLILTDPYFYNLDFKPEGFNEKYEHFLLLTFTIPIILSIIFCAYRIVKSNEKSDKIILAIASIFGILTFIYLDKFLKKALYFFDNILLSMVVITAIYIILFLLVFRQEKKIRGNNF